MVDSPEGSERNGRHRVVAALVLLWGFLLLVAYVAEHTADVSLLTGPPLPTASNGPGFSSAFIAASGAMLAAAAILGASVGYGALLSSFGLGSLGFGRLADACAQLMLGGGLLAVAVFGLGHAGLLTVFPACVLIAGGWAALAAVRWRSRRMPVDGERVGDAPTWRDPVVILAAIGLGAAFVMALLMALAPPTARDALAYHLAAPKAYIASNAIVELPWNVHSYLPFATEMLFTLGLLIGPDTSPGLIHLGYGVAVVVLVVVVTRRATGRRVWGIAAGLVVASVPSVVWNAGIAHNEMWMALAVTVAALAVGRWWETGDPRLLLWTGAAIGVALSAKHTALLLAPVLAVAVLLRTRSLAEREQKRTLLFAVLSGLVALSFPLPWYLQNVVRTGNPLFPYFWGLFPTRSPVWDAGRADVLETYLRLTYGQQDGVFAWLRLPWDVSIRALNDVTGFFDGVIGPVFLFLAPVAVVALLRAESPVWLRVAAAVACANVALWATQSQQIRFLIPTLPMLAIACVTATSRIGASGPSRTAMGPAVAVPLAGMIAASLAIAGLDVWSMGTIRPILGVESRSSYLGRRLAYFPFYERLNREIGMHPRVLLVDMRNDGYYLDVPFVSDSVLEDYSVGRVVNEAASAADVREGVRRLGVTHILVREDILLDHRFTPFADMAAASRWSGFLETGAERLESRDGTTLYALKN